MDSINKQQVEENHQDLSSAEAIKKIKDLVDSAKSCFFVTRAGTSASKGVRPMSVQQVDDQGVCWFLSANDSHKNLELATDNNVDLYFQSSAHAGFLHLEGTASVTEDEQKIKELWEPLAKTWFTDGEDDPRISAIKFVPKQGYYWDNKHGNLIAGMKMLAGAIVGKTLDDSIEGKIQL